MEEDRGQTGRTGERGFALVLAILSLMLLTFLGLTLATTTSTELQIATNYRWSQQALYNAEAGLEAARIVLSNVADVAAGWSAQLYAARGTTPGAEWSAGAAPTPSWSAAGEDFYRSDCDDQGGVGYGVVLADGAERYENVSSYSGQTLNGAFTVWIRRNLVVSSGGKYSDDPGNDSLTVVAQGVAPYTGPSEVFTRARQAVRVLETRYSLDLGAMEDPCLTPQGGQEGGSPMGENFNPCARLTPGSLEGAFGGTDAGNLTPKDDGGIRVR